MIKLLFKILIIGTLTIGCNLVLNKLFYNGHLPAWRGDKQMLGKYNTLMQNKGNYNTLFIGSSKTHYHVAPQIFDSVLNARTGAHIKSYNFGIDGMMPPETFFACRQLLQSDKLQVKNIIFELTFLKTSDTKNIFTWRGYYWADSSSYHFFTSAMQASISSRNSRLWNLALINFSRAENRLNLSKFNEYLDYAEDPSYIDPDQNHAGFEPLEARPITGHDYDLVQSAKTASLEAFQHFDDWSAQAPNQAYLGQVKELNALAKKRGIRIIYVMPLLWGYTWQYQELFPVYHALPPQDQVMMADGSRNSYMFNLKQLFDGNHMSGEGAYIYSADMAEEFVKRGVFK